MITTIEKQSKGLHRKYYIQKIVKVPNPDFCPTAKQSQVINNHDQYIDGLAAVDKGSEYFVLRLDNGTGDKEHLKACRDAVLTYAKQIKKHLPELSKYLIERYSVKEPASYRYEKGKVFRYDGVGEKGTYEVTKVCNPRKHTGTIFIHIKTLSGDIVPAPFMIGSPFDLNSNSINP